MYQDRCNNIHKHTDLSVVFSLPLSVIAQAEIRSKHKRVFSHETANMKFLERFLDSFPIRNAMPQLNICREPSMMAL